MKIIVFSAFLFLFSTFSFSQQKISFESFNDDYKFTQFELSLPLAANPNRDQVDENTNEKQSFFILDGICAKFGYGIHYEEWVGISLNTGIDWSIYNKLVSVPVYTQFTLNPKFSDENGILVQAGIGKSFAIGKNGLNGTYKKLRLGVIFDDIALFADFSTFGFKINNNEIGNISIGISVFAFDN